MTTSVKEKRWLLTECLALLIFEAGRRGFKCAVDQVKRTQAEANANAASGAGISNSLHLSGLAADVLLYRDGQYLDKTEDYKQLGEYWEQLHPLARWGGRFKKPDGNHFSITHGGVS